MRGELSLDFRIGGDDVLFYGLDAGAIAFLQGLDGLEDHLQQVHTTDEKEGKERRVSSCVRRAVVCQDVGMDDMRAAVSQEKAHTRVT